MFALETLKDLVLSGQAATLAEGARLPQPVSVGALVERRLAQLSSEALRLARVAALAGPDFGAELAAAVLEAHPLDIAEPWRELETAQVLRDGAFAHDLIFEATRKSVPEPIARLLHRRIAAHLVAGRALPDSVAPHWAGAAEWRLAGEAYAAAARRAREASQRTHEVECWRRAGTAFDQAGAAEAAFDARCESIHALIVVHGVTHAHARHRRPARDGPLRRAARRGADGEGDCRADGRRPFGRHRRSGARRASWRAASTRRGRASTPRGCTPSAWRRPAAPPRRWPSSRPAAASSTATRPPSSAATSGPTTPTC